jgi:hypothetical protein
MELEASLGKVRDPISKTKYNKIQKIQTKKSWGHTYVVRQMSSNYEALGSNPQY